MCGIAGILSLSPAVRVQPEPLRDMAAVLRHRGPDEQAVYLDPQGRCGFGFARLAIIDPAGGRQPISNEDGTVWLVFNGEIYNFRELQSVLAQLGHHFRTRADSEVIVHAYEQYGPGCLAHLDGMFALALWDQNRGQLLLARDRLGKKPLAWTPAGDRLYFASELKAIRAVCGPPAELDPQSLHRYLLLQYVPAPHSIYRGFRKLPPGTFLQVQAGRPTEPVPQTWWTLPDPPPFAGTYADAKARLGELLTAAVRRRLVADVPLGAFLSGGIDSSIVVGLMRRLGVQPLRTFTIGFPDARYDETAYARRVATHFGTEHHEHTVTPQASEVLDALAWHYDEPFADSSAIPTYYLSRWTRQSVTVALTGDAGDECFGGYDRYRALALASRLAGLPEPVQAGLRRAGRFLPSGRAKSLSRRAHRFLAASGQPPWRQYLGWIAVFSPELLADGYRPEFRAKLDFDEPLRWLAGLFEQAAGPPAARAMRVDFQSYLPYDLHTKVDIASMASSLECRAPFVDPALVEFALSLPLQWRLGQAGAVAPGWRGGKRILRDWAAELLPPEILRRRKMGFGVPVGEWFRNELREELETRVLAPDALAARIFRPEWLRGLVADHVSGRASHEPALWALLMLELWRQRWQPAGI